jgi:hypothetical protein
VKSADDFWELARVRKSSSGIPIGRAYWRDMFSINESRNGSVEWLFVSSDIREMGCMRALYMFGKRLIKYNPITREACERYSRDIVAQILTGMTLLVNVLIPKETTFCCSSCSKEKGVRQRYVHMIGLPCVTFRPPRPGGPVDPNAVFPQVFRPRVKIASDIEMSHDQHVNPDIPPPKYRGLQLCRACVDRDWGVYMGGQDQDHGPTYLQLQPKTVGADLATMYHDAKGVDLPPLDELLVDSHLFYRCPSCESDCGVTSTIEHLGAPLYSFFSLRGVDDLPYYVHRMQPFQGVVGESYN